MKQILFLSKGDHSPSTRYRARAYFDLFEREGWKPLHLTLSGGPLQRMGILKEARRSAVVVILRKLLSPVFMGLLKRVSPVILYDFDDGLFCRDDGSPSPSRERGFGRMVRLCDYVLAGNGYLAEEARKFNSSVTVLPTAVDPTLYDLNSPKPRDTLDLCWIGSSATRKYLEDLMPLLERLSGPFPTLRLKIISDFSLSSSGFSLVHVPWREETETLEISGSHIGIAPMVDNRWTRGKCGLKVLQYMAGGLPVLASSVGVHRDLVESATNGFFVETLDDWEGALSALQNPVLRRKMGMAGRKKVEESYCRERVFEKMMGVLKRLH